MGLSINTQGLTVGDLRLAIADLPDDAVVLGRLSTEERILFTIGRAEGLRVFRRGDARYGVARKGEHGVPAIVLTDI